MEKIQTAIDWLLDEYTNNSIISADMIQEAQRIFEQQIEKAWENGYDHGACVNTDKDKYHGSQYYDYWFGEKKLKKFAQKKLKKIIKNEKIY